MYRRVQRADVDQVQALDGTSADPSLSLLVQLANRSSLTDSVVLPARRHAPYGRGAGGRSTRDPGLVLTKMSFHDVLAGQALLHINPELDPVRTRHPTLVYVSSLEAAQSVCDRLQRLIGSHGQYGLASRAAAGGPFGPLS